MWNLGKRQVFPAGSSPPREPERQIAHLDPSRPLIRELRQSTSDVLISSVDFVANEDRETLVDIIVANLSGHSHRRCLSVIGPEDSPE